MIAGILSKKLKRIFCRPTKPSIADYYISSIEGSDNNNGTTMVLDNREKRNEELMSLWQEKKIKEDGK